MHTKRLFRLSVFIVSLALLVAGLAGCGQKAQQPGTSSASSGKMAAPKAVMTSGSGGTGSVYITYMAAFSDLLMSKFQTSINVEPGGSSQNMQFIDRGDQDFGITSTSQAYQGYYGDGWAKGQKYQKVNALFPAYPAISAMFAPANSDIKNIMDLNGKRVGLGVPASGSDVMMRQMFDLFGIKPARIVNGSWDDTAGMMRDGLVDCIVNIGGQPAGFIQELETAKDLRFFTLTPDQAEKFTKAYPYYGMSGLKAGTYKGLKETIQVPAIWNFIIASSNLPEDFIYNVMKTTFENVDKIHNANASFVDTKLENAKYMTIPLHPGAIKFYKEKGIPLPTLPPPPQGK